MARSRVDRTLTRRASGPGRAARALAATRPGAPGAPIGEPARRELARYELRGEHGRGGIGLVRRAYDRQLGRDVAIKELIDPNNNTGQIRFLREAMITARLEHPGIVPVHEAGNWADGTPYYAMKLVSGRSLRELFAERTSVDARIGLLHHVIAVADAIAYAHRQRVIHRDLKPANVIVGEFGETVVIDWGLAKDLAASDELAIGSGAGTGATAAAASWARDDELTTTGSVLGTPAYMPPEQARGEHVDQRADVFALGAMLWELCALDHAPPDASAARQRTLRRAGIDRDLIAIIDKALDNDPARRYADAGALAGDLKAFHAGARITARRYSLPARLAHWIRRHRALAATIGAALAFALAASAWFVRGIAVERDRADRARDHAEATASDLMLEHAELQLRSDPTAAVATLAGYRGSDTLRRHRLVAEAEGRGIARASYQPHTNEIWMMAPEPAAAGDAADDAVISLSVDGLIRRTPLAAGARSTTLAADVSPTGTVAYDAVHHRFIYVTAAPGIAVFDLRSHAARKLTPFAAGALALSADGTRLAAWSPRGELWVWSIAADDGGDFGAVLHHGEHPGLQHAEFAARDRLIVQDGAGLRAIPLGPNAGPAAQLALAGITALDARDDRVLAGTAHGELVVLSAELVERGRGAPCRQAVAYARWIPRGDQLAFSCQDHRVGIAALVPGEPAPAVIDNLDVHSAAGVTPDPDGRYVVVIDESTTVAVYDVATGRWQRYDGSSQSTFALVPAPGFAHVMTCETTGAVRRWDPPTAHARVVTRAGNAILNLAFASASRTLFAAGLDNALYRIALVRDRSRADALAGHTSSIASVGSSHDGQYVVTTGYDDTARVWRVGDGALVRTFTDHAGFVGRAVFLADGSLASVGADGGLRQWTIDGTGSAVRLQHAAPLTLLDVLGTRGRVVVGDDAGTLWDVALTGGAARVVRRPDGATVNVLRASPTGRYLAIGDDAGVVAVYDTDRWQVVQTARLPTGIRQLIFDPLERDLVATSETMRGQLGHVRVIELAALPTARGYRWHDLASNVRYAAYAPDGDTLGFVDRDGGTWLYAIAGDRWTYAADHLGPASTIKFSPDGTQVATADRRGVVVVRDLADHDNP